MPYLAWCAENMAFLPKNVLQNMWLTSVIGVEANLSVGEGYLPDSKPESSPRWNHSVYPLKQVSGKRWKWDNLRYDVPRMIDEWLKIGSILFALFQLCKKIEILGWYYLMILKMLRKKISKISNIHQNWII